MEMRASQVIKGALGGGAKRKKKKGKKTEGGKKKGKERDTFKFEWMERCGKWSVTVIY